MLNNNLDFPLWSTRQVSKTETFTKGDLLAEFLTTLTPRSRSFINNNENSSLEAMLNFRNEPSAQLMRFSEFLKKERSHENLDLWMSIRNHALMYRRYKKLKEQHEKEPDMVNIGVDDDVKRQDMGSHEIIDISRLYVDRNMLRKSIKAIYLTYFSVGAVKEVNIPENIRSELKQKIKVEKRYDPAVFKDVRDYVTEMMKTDSYPRFLRQ